MNLYHIRIRPRGPFLTPWHSDTLHGSLCWELRRVEGDAAVKELLDRCRQGDPPFVLSDGFPGGLLPTPLHTYGLIPQAELSEQECFDLIGEWKKRRFVPLEAFESIRLGRLPDLPEQLSEPFVTATRLHATLDRRSNTTLSQGGLREEAETYLSPQFDCMSVYARIETEWVERLDVLWQAMSGTGYGKKKSVGKGAFDYGGMELFEGYSEIPEANGFVSLSHFVPARDDPTDGDYALLVKHGKLGEEFGLSENPFKRPLALLTPGSCFRTQATPKPWYGRAVDGLSPEHPEVLQLCFALALPVRMPEER